MVSLQRVDRWLPFFWCLQVPLTDSVQRRIQKHWYHNRPGDETEGTECTKNEDTLILQPCDRQDTKRDATLRTKPKPALKARTRKE